MCDVGAIASVRVEKLSSFGKQEGVLSSTLITVSSDSFIHFDFEFQNKLFMDWMESLLEIRLYSNPIILYNV